MEPDIDYASPAIQEQVTLALSRRKLDFYRPYPRQLDFHGASKDPLITESAIIAGNQCQGMWNPVETGRATRQIREMIGAGPFDVQAWDGSSRCTMRASPVFLRGIETAYRLYLDNGQWFDGSAQHKILTLAGWRTISQIIRASNGLRYRQTLGGYRASCDAAPRRDDGPLHAGRGSAPARPQQGDDVLRDAPRHVAPGGEGARRSARTRLDPNIVHLPTQDEETLLWDLCATFEDPTERIRVQWPIARLRAWSRYAQEYARGRATRPPAHDQLLTSAVLAALPEDWDARDEEATPEGSPMCDRHTRGARQSLSWFGSGQYTIESLQSGTHDQCGDILLPCHTPSLVGGSRIIAVVPIGYQPILDFCVPGVNTYISGGLISANCGKTLAAAAQTAIFLTGQYPSWWNGRRWDRSVSIWAAGPTGQSTRDAPQKLLLGESNEWGTGMIPGRNIIEIKKSAHGVPDAVESVTVKHDPTGKTSRLLFKTYDQGRLRWQGATIDGIWFDEEPPEDIYSEGCTRCQVLGGFVFLTFTPLLGMSEVVTRFLKKRPPNSHVVKMGINDALHYTDAQRAAILARFPDHEREARAYGNPIMGSGRVFPIPWEFIAETPIQIPAYWRRLVGFDFGWDHPSAAVWLAHDPDSDTIHVTDCYKLREQTPVVHAAAIKARGAWIPVAWPADGLIHDPGSGKVLADLYRAQGVHMLKDHATHPPLPGKKEGTSGYSTEAGIVEMLDRMQTGRFKVFSTLAAWKDEFDLYYRKEGLIVKLDDDIMSATRVGCMSIRHAVTRIIPRSEAPLAPYVSSDPGMGTLG